MPKIQDANPETGMTIYNGGHFNFSTTKIDDLEATEYTLVTVVVDRSGSVVSFQHDMEKVLQEIVEACKKSPRADNLLLRLVAFESWHEEIHGFKKLADIDVASYNNCLNAGGATACFDSCVDAIEATNTLGKKLLEQDYSVNGIVFVITDGDDNKSKCTENQVKEAFAASVNGENLESMIGILIGVNVQDNYVKTKLEDFSKKGGFTHPYIQLNDANKKSLAKLGNFVSQSISSQSQALGSGGPSKNIQNLTF